MPPADHLRLVDTPPADEDGRSARARRTRERIVTAVIELLESGDLRPTAEAIAARAGVSQRSFFQHFPERDGVLMAVGERQRARIMAVVRAIPVDSPLDERIEALVHQRARVWELVTPVRRAALLNEPFSEDVAAGLGEFRERARREVAKVFARELDALPESKRDSRFAALCATLEWPYWESLRAHQALSLNDARAALHAAVSALLSN